MRLANTTDTESDVELVGETPAGPNGSGTRQPARHAPGDARGHNSEVVRQVENGTVVWRVRCDDLIGRERCATVFAENGQVVVSAPAGETARLTVRQAAQLRAAINEAAKLAER